MHSPFEVEQDPHFDNFQATVGDTALLYSRDFEVF